LRDTTFDQQVHGLPPLDIGKTVDKDESSESQLYEFDPIGELIDREVRENPNATSESLLKSPSDSDDRKQDDIITDKPPNGRVASSKVNSLTVVTIDELDHLKPVVNEPLFRPRQVNSDIVEFIASIIPSTPLPVVVCDPIEFIAPIIPSTPFDKDPVEFIAPIIPNSPMVVNDVQSVHRPTRSLSIPNDALLPSCSPVDLPPVCQPTPLQPIKLKQPKLKGDAMNDKPCQLTPSPLRQKVPKILSRSNPNSWAAKSRFKEAMPIFEYRAFWHKYTTNRAKEACDQPSPSESVQEEEAPPQKTVHFAVPCNEPKLNNELSKRRLSDKEDAPEIVSTLTKKDKKNVKKKAKKSKKKKEKLNDNNSSICGFTPSQKVENMQDPSVIANLRKHQNKEAELNNDIEIVDPPIPDLDMINANIKDPMFYAPISVFNAVRNSGHEAAFKKKGKITQPTMGPRGTKKRNLHMRSVT